MARVRNRGTGAEMAVRKILHRMGYRYRVNLAIDKGLRTKPDIVFTRHRLAIFIDGCFWHRCPEHATFPKANQEWWAAKLEANVRRDRVTDQALSAAGWSVMRIWEHEDPKSAADRIAKELDRLAVEPVRPEG